MGESPWTRSRLGGHDPFAKQKQKRSTRGSRKKKESPVTRSRFFFNGSFFLGGPPSSQFVSRDHLFPAFSFFSFFLLCPRRKGTGHRNFLFFLFSWPVLFRYISVNFSTCLLCVRFVSSVLMTKTSLAEDPQSGTCYSRWDGLLSKAARRAAFSAKKSSNKPAHSDDTSPMDRSNAAQSTSCFCTPPSGFGASNAYAAALCSSRKASCAAICSGVGSGGRLLSNAREVPARPVVVARGLRSKTRSRHSVGSVSRVSLMA